MAPSVSKEELMRNSDPLVWSLSGGNSSPEAEPNRLCERVWVFLNSRVCNIVVVTLVNIETIVIVSKLLITLEVVQDPNWRSTQPTANCSVNSSAATVQTGTTATSPEANPISPKLTEASVILTNISTTILTIFLIEIILRLLTGRFRYITQGTEVFDAILVLIVFSLGIAFLTTPSQPKSGRDGVLCLIVLRLWRIRRVFRSITDAAKVELSQVVHTYHREKTQAEHKVDILILKVEDLEHEVAYLKEKLKKTERESLIVKKRRSKEGSGRSNHHQHYNTVSATTITTPTTTATIAIETVHSTWPSTATQTGISTERLGLLDEPGGKSDIVLEMFAGRVVERLLFEAMADFTALPKILTQDELGSIGNILGSSPPVPTIGEPPKYKNGTKLKRRPDGSLESGYGSGASSINWDRVRGAKMAEDAAPSQSQSGGHQMTVIANVTAVSPGGHLGLFKCPESSPESGYGSSSASAALHQRTSSASPVDPAEVTDLSSSGSAKHKDTAVFLFPDPPSKGTSFSNSLAGKGALNQNQISSTVVNIQDPAEVELEWLDEQSEIERVKRVEFDPHRKDKGGVPMTSL